MLDGTNGRTPTIGHVIYTRHARRRMRWREVTEDEVEEAIRHPDRLEPCQRGRTNAFKLIGTRHIRVTFRASEAAIVVITVVDRAN